MIRIKDSIFCDAYNKLKSENHDMTDNAFPYFLWVSLLKSIMFFPALKCLEDLFFLRKETCAKFENLHSSDIFEFLTMRILLAASVWFPPQENTTLKHTKPIYEGDYLNGFFCAEHQPPNLRQVAINSRSCNNNIAPQFWGHRIITKLF